MTLTCDLRLEEAPLNRRFVFPALCASIGLFALAGSARAQTATFPYDHVHVNVPDPGAAANWYEKNFGGRINFL